MSENLISVRFEHAIALCKTFEDIEYIRQKIDTTALINRRTKAGRDLTEQLIIKANNKYRELAEKYPPF